MEGEGNDVENRGRVKEGEGEGCRRKTDRG